MSQSITALRGSHQGAVTFTNTPTNSTGLSQFQAQYNWPGAGTPVWQDTRPIMYTAYEAQLPVGATGTATVFSGTMSFTSGQNTATLAGGTTNAYISGVAWGMPIAAASYIPAGATVTKIANVGTTIVITFSGAAALATGSAVTTITSLSTFNPPTIIRDVIGPMNTITELYIVNNDQVGYVAVVLPNPAGTASIRVLPPQGGHALYVLNDPTAGPFAATNVYNLVYLVACDATGNFQGLGVSPGPTQAYIYAAGY